MLISILTEFQCISTKSYNRLINTMGNDITDYYLYKIIPYKKFCTKRIIAKYIGEENGCFFYDRTYDGINKGFWRGFYES